MLQNIADVVEKDNDEPAPLPKESAAEILARLPHYTPATIPFVHQALELVEHWKTPGRAILWEPGTGKTKEAIDTACALWAAGEIDAVAVVAPNGVHRNWSTDEVPRHAPPAIQEQIAGHVWRGQSATTKWHQRGMDYVLNHQGFAWLYLSFDSVMTDAGRDFLWKFLRHRRVLYLVDESHHIKTPSAKRTIRIVKSGKYAPYRRILTGTPTSKGPFDIYSQIRFVDEDFWDQNGFASYAAFKTHFGVWFTRAQCQALHNYDPGFDKLLGYKNLDQLREILKKISSRVTKKQAGLNLPDKLYRKRYYELTPEQVRLYTRLKEDFYVEMADGAVVEAALPIVRLLRFQQICCGYVATDAEEPLQMIPGPNPLLDSLGSWAEDIHQKAIIWARFTRDIDMIIDMLRAKGADVVRYDGQISDDEAFDNSEKFKMGKAQYIVGNPQKGKEGLTWNMAHHVAYYNNSFKLLDRIQSEDRAHRIGMKQAVDYTDFVAQFTVGEKVNTTVSHHILNALRNNQDIASQITGDELKEWI